MIYCSFLRFIVLLLLPILNSTLYCSPGSLAREWWQSLDVLQQTELSNQFTSDWHKDQFDISFGRFLSSYNNELVSLRDIVPWQSALLARILNLEEQDDRILLVTFGYNKQDQFLVRLAFFLSDFVRKNNEYSKNKFDFDEIITRVSFGLSCFFQYCLYSFEESMNLIEVERDFTVLLDITTNYIRSQLPKGKITFPILLEQKDNTLAQKKFSLAPAKGKIKIGRKKFFIKDLSECAMQRAQTYSLTEYIFLWENISLNAIMSPESIDRAQMPCAYHFLISLCKEGKNCKEISFVVTDNFDAFLLANFADLVL